MQLQLTLKRRILVAFSVFGLVLAATMALSLYTFLGVIEESIIRQTMQYEMSELLSRADATVPGREGTETVTIWSTPLDSRAGIPAYLRELPAGVHRVSHGDRQYRVRVADNNGMRQYLRFDVTQIVARDRQVFAALMKSLVMAVAVSLVAGWLLARRVTRPIRKLSDELHELDVGSPGEHALTDYPNDEIGALAQRFRDYHERFRNMLQREHEFASNVSHELRTPVTSINMAVEVLANDPSISGRQGERLRRIQRAGKEMSELVNTFMLLARTEDADRESRSDCDVNETVRAVLDEQKVWLGGKAVNVTLDESCHLVVPAPHGVVAVLIANIVRNAFRYTQQGWVRVTVTSSGVVVEDSGPGISAELAERLFDRNVHGPQGSGLGLSIVKRICERYNWRVLVDTTSGAGTRFDIEFMPPGSASAEAPGDL